MVRGANIAPLQRGAYGIITVERGTTHMSTYDTAKHNENVASLVCQTYHYGFRAVTSQTWETNASFAEVFNSATCEELLFAALQSARRIGRKITDDEAELMPAEIRAGVAYWVADYEGSSEFIRSLRRSVLIFTVPQMRAAFNVMRVELTH